MAQLSTKEAVELTVMRFFQYAFSLIAALLVNEGLRHELKIFKQPRGRRWAMIIGIVFSCLAFLVIFTILDEGPSRAGGA